MPALSDVTWATPYTPGVEIPYTPVVEIPKYSYKDYEFAVYFPTTGIVSILVAVPQGHPYYEKDFVPWTWNHGHLTHASHGFAEYRRFIMASLIFDKDKWVFGWSYVGVESSSEFLREEIEKTIDQLELAEHWEGIYK